MEKSRCHENLYEIFELEFEKKTRIFIVFLWQ